MSSFEKTNWKENILQSEDRSKQVIALWLAKARYQEELTVIRERGDALEA